MKIKWNKHQENTQYLSWYTDTIISFNIERKLQIYLNISIEFIISKDVIIVSFMCGCCVNSGG